MNKIFPLILIAFTFGPLAAQAQIDSLLQASSEAAEKNFSLNQAIQRAQKQSPSYARAINRAENRYWNFRQYQASRLPQLSIQGTFPDYSSATDRVTQNDGTFAFREREQFYWSSRLALTQNVPWTGGQVQLSSGLQRTRVIRPTERINYFYTPLSISYIQPMVLYNEFRWLKDIEPLRYRESQRRYNEELEGIAAETSRLYFDALDASMQVRIARQNVENNDTIYRISQGRYELGKIAENDLLQVELNLLNAKNALTQAQVQYQVAVRALVRYLSLDQGTKLDLEVPQEVPHFQVPLEKALEEAQKNRAAVLEYRRRRLEADQSVAQARANTDYSVQVNANFGVSRQAQELGLAYSGNLLPQQNISLGLNIPILDWGRARARMRKAKANRDLERVDISQDELNFEQEIFLQVMEFNTQNQQLRTASKADTVARRRYEVAKARYLTGKITITDLNIAQNEKDRARQDYLRSLRSFWLAYYTLRRLTLYDFIEEGPITYDADYAPN